MVSIQIDRVALVLYPILRWVVTDRHIDGWTRIARVITVTPCLHFAARVNQGCRYDHCSLMVRTSLLVREVTSLVPGSHLDQFFFYEGFMQDFLVCVCVGGGGRRSSWGHCYSIRHEYAAHTF